MNKNSHISQKVLGIKILNPNQILGSIKPHIVVNNLQSKYTLLDADLNVIDEKKQIPGFNMLYNSHRLRKFKRQLMKDLRAYKKTCKLLHKKPSKSFLKMHRDIQFYLSICPDADYCILELLRNNVVGLNIGYSNYQSACAEYLRQLARLENGDPALMPFDINFATPDNKINSKHKFISNSFISEFEDPVQKFKSLFKKPRSEREKYIESHSNFYVDRLGNRLSESKYTQTRQEKTKTSSCER